MYLIGIFAYLLRLLKYEYRDFLLCFSWSYHHFFSCYSTTYERKNANKKAQKNPLHKCQILSELALFLAVHIMEKKKSA